MALLAPRDLDQVVDLAGLPAAWLVIVHSDGVVVLSDQRLLAVEAECDTETAEQLRRATAKTVMDSTIYSTSCHDDVP